MVEGEHHAGTWAEAFSMFEKYVGLAKVAGARPGIAGHDKE